MAAAEPRITIQPGSEPDFDITAIVVQTIFGWPGIILALVLMGAGLWLRKHRLHLAGVLVSTGFCLYLAGGNWLLGPAIYACNWGSWYFLRKNARLLAVALLAPYALVTVYFALAVLSQ